MRRSIGLSGQYAAVDEYLTGRENLVMVGRLYHFGMADSRARATELLEQFDLVEAADRPAKTYSGGMRRRLDLAGALVARPPIIFLDEPTTGLDPRSRIGLWDVIEGLVAEGTTVLLTTQYLDEADKLADSIAVVDRGRVIARGTSDELKAQVGGERLAVTVGAGQVGDAPRGPGRAGQRRHRRRRALPAARRPGRRRCDRPARGRPGLRRAGRARSSTSACAGPPSTTCSWSSPATTRGRRARRATARIGSDRTGQRRTVRHAEGTRR